MSAEVDEAAMDRASEADRIWFEQHPRRQHRVRPYVPGELPVHGIAGDGRWCVAVRNVRPGMRVRLPIYVGRLPPGDEQTAAVIFAHAFGGDA